MPRMPGTEELTVEQRLERLEAILAKVLLMAEVHPVGKQMLKMLGLS